MPLLNNLVAQVIDGPDRWLVDERTGLKVVKTRDHLLIYRHGVRKLWLDLELKYLLSFNLQTQAEVNAFNNVLALAGVSDHYAFMRSGRMVLLDFDNEFYRSEDYESKFGPESGNYSYEGSCPPPA